jgi:hypothetical protein
LLTVSVIRLLVSSLTVARSGPTRIDECDAPRVLTATIRDLFTGTTKSSRSGSGDGGPADSPRCGPSWWA